MSAGALAMAWRQARRDLAAGEVRILLAALVLAVLSITAVGQVTCLLYTSPSPRD